MLTPQAFADLQVFLDDVISYAAVTIDGKTEKYPIYRREHLEDGHTAIFIQITPENAAGMTVQEVQLFNKNTQPWAVKAEKIPLEEVQEGVLYRFTFKFLEEEV